MHLYGMNNYTAMGDWKKADDRPDRPDRLTAKLVAQVVVLQPDPMRNGR
jgi:hypothetical protein